LEWSAAASRAVDALGNPRPVEISAGRLRLQLADTPVFVIGSES
jgi:hypothetical protein